MKLVAILKQKGFFLPGIRENGKQENGKQKQIELKKGLRAFTACFLFFDRIRETIKAY